MSKKTVGEEISVRELWYYIKQQLMKIKKLDKKDRKKYNGKYIVKGGK